MPSSGILTSNLNSKRVKTFYCTKETADLHGVLSNNQTPSVGLSFGIQQHQSEGLASSPHSQSIRFEHSPSELACEQSHDKT